MTDPFDEATSAGGVSGTLDEEGIERDGWGRYVIPHPQTKRKMGWTRVTTFAKSISDTYALDMWGRRMVAKGLSMRRDLVLAAAACDVSKDRDRLNGIAKEAADAAAARAGANLGTALHSFSEMVDRGENPEIPPPWDKAMAAYSEAMKVAGLKPHPDRMEQIIVNMLYKVAGKYDRVLEATKYLKVKFPGKPAIIIRPGDLLIGDLKTGRDLQYGWGEIAVQLATYANASSIWDRVNAVHLPMFPVRKDVAIVMHVPAVGEWTGEDKATLYFVDIQTGWEGADLCAKVRKWRSTRGLSEPVGIVEISDDEISASSPSWAERIARATTAAQLSAIRHEAMARNEWTPELLALGLERQKLFGN